MKSRSFAIALVVCLCWLTAFAEPPGNYGSTVADDSNLNWDGIPLPAGCDKDQMTVNACAGDVWRAADQELNDIFQLQLRYLKEGKEKWGTDGKDIQRLVDAQRAWVQFRDKDCIYQVGEPGSAAPFETYKCRYKRTLTRISELREYVSCRANGCPY